MHVVVGGGGGEIEANNPPVLNWTRVWEGRLECAYDCHTEFLDCRRTQARLSDMTVECERTMRNLFGELKVNFEVRVSQQCAVGDTRHPPES